MGLYEGGESIRFIATLYDTSFEHVEKVIELQPYR